LNCIRICLLHFLVSCDVTGSPRMEFWWRAYSGKMLKD
jgi:hypothetical protein